MTNAISQYVDDVKTKDFPNESEQYYNRLVRYVRRIGLCIILKNQKFGKEVGCFVLIFITQSEFDSTLNELEEIIKMTSKFKSTLRS